MYTTLEAVKRILDAIGEPTVGLSLDTGAASLAGEAEVYLDRARHDILSKEWRCATKNNYKLELSTVKITATGGSGTFVYDETITGSASNATGKFQYADGNDLYLAEVSGTFTVSDTLSAPSGATRATVSAVDTSPTGVKIPWDTTNWLEVRPDIDHESIEFATVGSFLYDFDDNTDVFTDDVVARITLTRAFTDLPVSLQRYIVATAMANFYRYKRQTEVPPRWILAELEEAKGEALQEDADASHVNILNARDARRIKGRRRTVRFY